MLSFSILMDDFRVWLQGRNTPERVCLASDVSYDDVLILCTTANVKQCTLTFNADFDTMKKSREYYWLIFDMGYNYYMYGDISIDTVKVLDLQRNHTNEEKQFLGDRSCYFRPNNWSASESWFRVIQIPICVSRECLTFHVSFHFTFLANVSHDENLYFSFPMFADPQRVQNMNVTILQRGKYMEVTGLPLDQGFSCCGQIDRGHDLNICLEKKCDGHERHEIEGGILKVFLTGQDSTNRLKLQTDKMAMMSVFHNEKPTLDLESIAHAIFVCTDIDREAENRAKGIAQLLSKRIPCESKCFSYYWHAAESGKFKRGQPCPNEDEVENIADDILEQLENVNNLHLWIIYPKCKLGECLSQITSVVKKLSVQVDVHHVWTVDTGKPDIEVPGGDQTCELPRGCAMTRIFEASILQACFGTVDRPGPDFPVMCGFWPDRIMHYLCKDSKNGIGEEPSGDLEIHGDLSKEASDMFDILYRAKEVIDKENKLLKMKGIQDMDFIQMLLGDVCDDKTPFSRMWILRVEETKQEGKAVTVVEPASNESSLLEFDRKSYESFFCDGQKKME